MKIIGASVLEFRRTLDGRSWNPAIRWTERRAPLLLLHADSGEVGHGEAWSRQAAIGHVLHHLAASVAPQLIGRRVDEQRELVDALARAAVPDASPWIAPAAASAVDIALWDLRAKVGRAPLWRLLAANGGNASGAAKVDVYASGGLYRDGTTAADLARELAGYVEQGFTAVKMKIGALALADDLARVRAARTAIGPDVTLWVDAVNQLSNGDAIAWCNALAEYDVGAIQAPVPFADVAAMTRINRDGLPVIAAEVEHCHARFAQLLDAKAVTYLQFCLGLAGGFAGAACLDTNAAAHGVATTPQCFSTAVLQAASLHFGAARGNVVAVEYHRFHDHLAALMPPAMRTIARGQVRLDDTPGLGLRPLAPGPQPCGGEIVTHARIGATH